MFLNDARRRRASPSIIAQRPPHRHLPSIHLTKSNRPNSLSPTRNPPMPLLLTRPHPPKHPPIHDPILKSPSYENIPRCPRERRPIPGRWTQLAGSEEVGRGGVEGGGLCWAGFGLAW